MLAITHYNASDWENLLISKAKSNLEMKNYLITAISNNGNLEFVLNLIASLTLHGYKKFLIICLDIELYENLIKYGFVNHIVLVPPSWIPYTPTSKATSWQTKDYQFLTQTKTHIVYRLLVHGFTILLTDVDLVWLSPHILKYIDFVAPKRDFIYAVDDQVDVNTGFYVVRPTSGGKKIFEAIIERQRTDHDNDQFVANRVFRAKKDLLNNSCPLDKLLFTNGEVYHRNKLNQDLNIPALVFHANYLIGFEQKKKVLMDEDSFISYGAIGTAS
uniref:Nucleotide-diphospho-sugar transferase domain-containing protein n=1 Tax=Acrobeloides nanus TaxID=290746 RepID=A0A914CK60_9BILA